MVCTHCGRALVASMARPIVDLSSGTFHYDCWQTYRAVEAKKNERVAAASAQKKAERAEAARLRMKARWAAKDADAPNPAVD